MSTMAVRAHVADERRNDAPVLVQTNQDDDPALVGRVLAGDQEAFRELVERYQRRVFSLANSLLGNTGEAEDIAQRVFCKAYFSLHRFQFHASLFSWLHRITVNECFDEIRRRRQRRNSFVAEADLRENDQGHLERMAAPRAHDFAERLALRELVVRLLDTLNAEERNLLLMKELDGYRVREIASLIGLNENTVKVKLLRARRKMVAAAARSGIGDPLRRVTAG